MAALTADRVWDRVEHTVEAHLRRHPAAERELIRQQWIDELTQLAHDRFVERYGKPQRLPDRNVVWQLLTLEERAVFVILCDERPT